MSPVKRPAAEVSIDVGLVSALVAEQHGDLAHLPVVHEAGGWDNEIFRLGSEYAVRIPRRRMAAALIDHEMAWLPSWRPGCRCPSRLPSDAAPQEAAIPGRGASPDGSPGTRWRLNPSQPNLPQPVDPATSARTWTVRNSPGILAGSSLSWASRHRQLLRATPSGGCRCAVATPG